MFSKSESLFAGFESLDRGTSLRAHGILIPARVKQEIEDAALTVKIVKEAAETKSAKVAVTVLPALHSSSPGPNDLASIRRDANHDLADATALTSRLLKNHLSGLDNFSAVFCKDLFTAVALRVVYSENYSTWVDVLKYCVDPLWDSPNQMFADLANSSLPDSKTVAGRWMCGTMRPISKMSTSSLERLVQRSYAVFKDAIAALNSDGKLKGRRAGRANSIQVFTPEAMAKAFAHLDKVRGEQRDCSERDLTAARTNDGFRLVPNVRKAAKNLEQVAAEFENLAEPIKHLQTQLALAGAMAPGDFHLPPMLLLGDPGIGKTHLALQLANALGVPMDKLSAGASQAAFQLTGSHPSWNYAMPGSIFTMLSTGTSATPVIVIDEVDKIGEGGRYPLTPALLDMLEPGTARTFKDAFYDLEFDASRIIFVLTANDLAAVPAPLLSRMAVFNVPRPQPAQRLRIIQGEIDRLCLKTRKRINLDATVDDLAERVDLDLRQTIRLVQEAFSKAMVARSTTANVVVPALSSSRSIGFMAR